MMTSSTSSTSSISSKNSKLSTTSAVPSEFDLGDAVGASQQRQRRVTTTFGDGDESMALVALMSAVSDCFRMIF
jgi:hypothetical protein